MRFNPYPETDGVRTALAIAEREPQWYSIANRVPEGASTAEMLAAGHLDNWNLRLEPLVTQGRFHRSMFETVRDNPFDGLPDTLGIVGSRYNIFSNEELFSFGDNMLHGGNWTAAGAIANGTRVFGLMRLNDGLTLSDGNRNDEHERYLCVYTSHDGTTNLSVSIITLRLRCTNAITAAVRGAQQTFKIRHSQSMDGKVAEAREVLGLSNLYYDAFSAEMNKLISEEVTLAEARRIVEAVYPEPDADKKGAMTRWENKVSDIFGIYNGESLENVHGTKYGIYNAMTEYLDWFRTPRKGDTENLSAAFTGFDPQTNKEKDRILAVVSA